MSAKENAKEKKQLRIPHTYVILFAIVLLMAVLSWIVPAGEYDRVYNESTDRNVVDPDSYHLVDAAPVGPFDLFMSITLGMQQSSGIIFFILILGGAFEIVNSTGAIEAGISRLALKMRNKDMLLIPVIMGVFFVFGGTIGMSEECIAFVPIGIALARALGYDAIAGTAMVTIGAACGFTSGFMNPFTVGVAQGIAELPPFSGIGLRLALGITVLIISIIYLIRYCGKIKKDPTKSLIYDVEVEESKSGNAIDLDNIPKFTASHALVLLTFFGGIVMLVVGVFKFGWYIDEIATVFLIVGILSGFFAKIGPSRICTTFLNGARGILFGALVVGIARAILVVMTQGAIIDSVIHGLAGAISSLPTAISAAGMYIVQIVINFFIPSGSGQAGTTMPIMTPLSDVLGIQRQVAVLCFQLGDGFTNSIIPTSASLMGALSIGKIPYEKWFSWIWRLMLIWIVVGLFFVLGANAFGYGPF